MNRLEFNKIGETLIQAEVNKLKVNILPKKGFSRSFAMLTTKYGSNDIKFSLNGSEEKIYPLGIAHFLEHKLFEQKEGNIFNDFALLSASPNAYTNFNVTSYYFTSTENFIENLKLLMHFVFNPYFTEESVNKEKGIIEQEIVMYEDNPYFKVFFNALQAMYGKHPVRNDIAGTVESINQITPELLYECYNAFYVPQNMNLTVVGDVDAENVLKAAQGLVPQSREDIRLVRGSYENENGIVEKSKHIDMGLSIPNFVLGFKDCCSFKENNYLRKKVIMDILGRLFFSRSSSAYESLYNSGLINESFSYEFILDREYAHFILSGESKSPEKVRNYVVEQFCNKTNYNIPEGSFERVKKMLIGSFFGRLNSIEASGNTLSDYYAKDVNYLEYYSVLKEIKKVEVEEAAGNLFNIDNSVLSTVN